MLKATSQEQENVRERKRAEIMGAWKSDKISKDEAMQRLEAEGLR